MFFIKKYILLLIKIAIFIRIIHKTEKNNSYFQKKQICHVKKDLPSGQLRHISIFSLFVRTAFLNFIALSPFHTL